MHKVVVIIMMLFLGVGLTQPSGYMQYCNLQEQYKHCSDEDHDITPLDFVFEHLLNLESIVNLLEGEHEYVAGDHVHQPFQASQSVVQVQLALPNTLHFEIAKRHPVFGEVVTYPLGKSDFYSSRTGTNIFRPPIFA